MLAIRPCLTFLTNRRAIARMFVRPSVYLSGTDVHFDHTVHFSLDLSLWLESPMCTLTSKHVHPLPAVFFSVPPGRKVEYGCTGRIKARAQYCGFDGGAENAGVEKAGAITYGKPSEQKTLKTLGV